MAPKRSRKRKRTQAALDDSDNEDDQPSRKRKRLKTSRPPLRHNLTEVTPRKRRASRRVNRRNKALSLEPKASPNPYNTRRSSRLHSKYVTNINKATDPEAGESTDEEIEENDPQSSSPSTMSISQSTTPESPTPTMPTMAQKIALRSQPSTPNRGNVRKRSAKLSKSAHRKTSPKKKIASRLPAADDSPIADPAGPFDSDCDTDGESEHLSFESLAHSLRRKKTPNWRESNDSLEVHSPQKPTYHAIDVSEALTPDCNEGCTHNRVIPAMTDPVTHKYSYSGYQTIPFAAHPPSYSMNLNTSHYSTHSAPYHTTDTDRTRNYNRTPMGPGTPAFHRSDSRFGGGKPYKLSDDGDIWSIRYWSNKLKQNGAALKQSLVYSVVGFLAGVTVAYSGFHYYGSHQFRFGNPVMKTLPADSLRISNLLQNQGTCSCDVTENSTTSQCNPCMDEYWALHTEFKQCDGNQIQLERERDELKAQLRNQNKCQSTLTGLRHEVSQCAADRNSLQKQLNSREDTDTDCTSRKAEIRQLEHELGECNVEWGACQQVGRQRDKLDEKRLEEIERQKKRFTLCNDQLKRYKDVARQQRGNQ